jgi:membrane-associated protease RseP (regulator of RpoE activity)
MLNEPASSPDDRLMLRQPVGAPPSAEQSQQDILRALAETALTVERESFYTDRITPELTLMMAAPGSRPLATFEGTLIGDSESSYERIDAQAKPHDILPLFRTTMRDGVEKHVVHLLQGRTSVPQQRVYTTEIILFVLTLLSVLYVGTIHAISEIFSTNELLAQQLLDNLLPELWRGIPYAASILLILGAHELGHFFAARFHRLSVSPPRFIPFPLSDIGTMGAFIVLREPMRNRKMLLDVGAAGPLFGLLFAIPIVVIGIATSPVNPIPSQGMLEGNSFLYALVKTLVHGRFLPDGQVDVFLNQVAWAGWVGLLITGINLMPLGQLDGGHVLYSLIGHRARLLYYPALIALIGLTLFGGPGSSMWVLWVILLFFFGRVYAAPLDDITPLDARRRWIAILTMIIFVLVFVPLPFTFYTNPNAAPTSPQPTLPAPDGSTLWLPVLFASLWLRQRGARRG